jgi:catechol 2,3-dioxygenase-like lactoylglutathione lyase family enzyme
MCRDFYVQFLGLRVEMDLERIVTYVSPSNPTAQISLVREGAEPDLGGVLLSVEVDDVDRTHAEAIAFGYRIVYPLTDEPWGVRRVFVADPNGVVINIMCHTTPSEKR